MEESARERERQISKASNPAAALEHAIGAADLYMKAAETVRTASERARLRQKCNELISVAERLKKLNLSGEVVGVVEKRLGIPRLKREIPTAEKNLLWRGSKLHGSIFPPWEAEPNATYFEGDIFCDSTEFPLSERQMQVFAGWKRAHELFARSTSNFYQTTKAEALMHAENDQDLVQDITTDCSVVASLCAGFKHIAPGPRSILPALLFPTDLDSGQPQLSGNGRYVFRMCFNGCFRNVVIDDRLPSSANGRTLYVVDRQNPQLIWPALLEKAYLKVRGGYDFPGSNSGTDLWILTGWIPQQVFLRNDDIDLNQTWSRIKKAHEYSDVIVTLGTGRLRAEEEEILGLAGEHDYAVLELSEVAGNRSMLVKNPWCDGLVWKGTQPSSQPVSSSLASSLFIGDQKQRQQRPQKLTPGSFWISFEDVTQNFESLYLNWNPGLFTDRQDHHFTWSLPPPTMVPSFAHNPQYAFTAAADGSVWVLLNRHFQDAELEISRARAANTDASGRLGFMSLYIFDSGGHRVLIGDKAMHRGHFVDSPQTLTTFEAKKGRKYTIVVAQHDLPLSSYVFTLSFFSLSPLDVEPASHGLRSIVETSGSWTRRSAGGNAAFATFVENPQFSLVVSRPGPLQILLSTSAPDSVAVHIDLVWAGGRRVHTLTVRDTVANSGEYRRGCALTHVPQVDAGTYTVVCSTFEPEQRADFTLRIAADASLIVEPIPAEGAGRFRAQLPPCVFGSSDGTSTLLSSSEFGQATPSTQRRRIFLSSSQLNKANLIITRTRPRPRSAVSHSHSPSANGSNCPSQPGTPRSHPTVRVRIERGRGPDRKVITATGDGEFKEIGLGLRTDDFRFGSHLGGLWIVVDQMGSFQADEGLAIEVLCEEKVQFGRWES